MPSWQLWRLWRSRNGLREPNAPEQDLLSPEQKESG